MTFIKNTQIEDSADARYNVLVWAPIKLILHKMSQCIIGFLFHAQPMLMTLESSAMIMQHGGTCRQYRWVCQLWVWVWATKGRFISFINSSAPLASPFMPPPPHHLLGSDQSLSSGCPPSTSWAQVRYSESTSGRTSHGSGSHSSNLSSVPRSVLYNPISVPLACLGHKHKCHASKQDDFSNNNNNFVPTSAPLPQMRCKSYFHYKDYFLFLTYLSQPPQGNLSLKYRVRVEVISSEIVTPLSYPGVALTLCCLLIILLPYLYDRTACFRLPDLSWI